MLLLLFQADENLYAIDTASVVEVLPIVTLRKIHQVPSYVAGVFSYRGCIVPVVDLCRLIRGTPCEVRFNTRIMMVNYTTKNGDRQYLGLMAERVTETIKQPDSDSAKTPLNDLPYLGEIFMHEKGMIQRLHWESLVGDAQNASLIAVENVQINNAS